MACTKPNWQLLLECAHELQRRGLSPFTRAELICCVQAVHPDHSSDSLGPIIQGMTRGATGGPRSACGTVFDRVDRGLYRLLPEAGDRRNGTLAANPPDARRASSGNETATRPDGGAARTLRRPRRTPRKAAEVERRLDGLAGDFARYVAVYDTQVPFTAADQYDSHRVTIDRRRALGGIAAALDDDDFITKLYRTLGRWGIGVRGSNLVSRDEFAAVLRARRGQLEALDPLAIEDPRLDINDVVGQVWALVAELPIVRNVARIVAATKTLHHVLPDLVVPMDRRWTGAFFWWSAVDPQSRQYQTFWLTYRDMISVARDVQPSQYVGDGWKTSPGKVIDNAVIGYCIAHGIGD